MESYLCSKERFLDDIKDHKLSIIKDNGIYRHIRMSIKDSGIYRYDIITFPYHLVVTGDMGTWIFSRIEDMFEFFIMGDTDFNKDNIINPYYWEEKLEAVSKFGSCEGSVKEFKVDLFRKEVTEYFEEYCNKNGIEKDSEEYEDLRDDIDFDIIHYAEDVHPRELFSRVHNFSSNNFEFNIEDFDFEGCYTYTFHYIWICYAIVYAIDMYNKSKEID